MKDAVNDDRGFLSGVKAGLEVASTFRFRLLVGFLALVVAAIVWMAGAL